MDTARKKTPGQKTHGRAVLSGGLSVAGWLKGGLVSGGGLFTSDRYIGMAFFRRQTVSLKNFLKIFFESHRLSLEKTRGSFALRQTPKSFTSSSPKKKCFFFRATRFGLRRLPCHTEKSINFFLFPRPSSVSLRSAPFDTSGRLIKKSYRFFSVDAHPISYLYNCRS